MSSITEKKYYDDDDILKAIERAVKNEPYKKLFNILHEHFIMEENGSVSAKEIAKVMLILNYTRAYHLLDSFVNIHLLKRHKIGNRIRFVLKPDSIEFWKEVKRGLK